MWPVHAVFQLYLVSTKISSSPATIHNAHADHFRFKINFQIRKSFIGAHNILFIRIRHKDLDVLCRIKCFYQRMDIVFISILIYDYT